MRKNKGPKIDPCGTPVVTGSSSDLWLLYSTYCDFPDKLLHSNLFAHSFTP